jgi:hypothetical protein
MARRRGQTNWTYLDDDLKYSRDHVLGQGGFGSVHLGRFRGNKVAIKKIQLHTTSNDEREIRLQGKLKHRNVLPILTATEDEDFRYNSVSFSLR